MVSDRSFNEATGTMKMRVSNRSSAARRMSLHLGVGGTCLVMAAQAVADWQPVTNLTLKAAAAVRVAYDSNVYLQDTAAAPGVTGVVPAEHGSWVFSVLPQLGLAYQPCEAFKLQTGYAGEYTWFERASSEDHRVHRFPLNASGKVSDTSWAVGNSFTYIDGADEGPTFGRPADIPAIGGVPLRDRRSALIYRGSLKVRQPLGGPWFLEPVANAYVHDFYTVQKANPVGPNRVYENYVDRQEVTGGLMIGRDIGRHTDLSLGYVYGRQDQFSLLGNNSPYDSHIHRILMGLRGRPASWVQLDWLVGPDFRDFDREIAGFDDDEVLAFVQCSATLLPTKADRIVLFNKRYLQPAYGGPSVYEDVTYRITWLRQWCPEFSSQVGFQAYQGDWQLPARRDDWIFTPSVSLTYKWRKKLTVQLAYSYDWTDTEYAGVTYSDGRNFSRHLTSLLVGYQF